MSAPRAGLPKHSPLSHSEPSADWVVFLALLKCLTTYIYREKMLEKMVHRGARTPVS